MSINRVTISGNLTRDPQIRSTQSGTNILSLGIAVNDRHKNSKTGEWEDYANFIDVCVFGKRADSLSRILKKGTKVCIDGKLRYSSWERNGQKRSKLEVIADDVDIMQSRNANNSSQGGYGQQPNNYTNNQQYGPQNASQGFSGGYQQQDVYDSDIPW